MLTAAGGLVHWLVKKIWEGHQQYPLGLKRLSYNKFLFRCYFHQESSPELPVWVWENSQFFLSLLSCSKTELRAFSFDSKSKQPSHNKTTLQLIPKLKGGLAVSAISKMSFYPLASFFFQSFPLSFVSLLSFSLQLLFSVAPSDSIWGYSHSPSWTSIFWHCPGSTSKWQTTKMGLSAKGPSNRAAMLWSSVYIGLPHELLFEDGAQWLYKVSETLVSIPQLHAQCFIWRSWILL